MSREHPQAGTGEAQIAAGNTSRDRCGADHPHLWLVTDLAGGTDQPHGPTIALLVHL
ncbi:hypothetical protein [Sphingomonas sp. Leaf21]|uniref:hypothetical protein n=1 Tax=Sphingomonas sp. Leaf21 TaxID=2876550 RepID=UPI001E63B447|nr:hypothetical protein [Sphingomonas sp. Leaf21]